MQSSEKCSVAPQGIISIEDSYTSENLIIDYLEVYTGVVSLDRVRTKSSGFFVSWIVDSLQSLPEDEKNKVGKVAVKFSIPEVEVYASAAYYDRNKEVIDARILMNKMYHDASSANDEAVRFAGQILDDASGKTDHLFEEISDLSCLD